MFSPEAASLERPSSFSSPSNSEGLGVKSTATTSTTATATTTTMTGGETSLSSPKMMNRQDNDQASIRENQVQERSKDTPDDEKMNSSPYSTAKQSVIHEEPELTSKQDFAKNHADCIVDDEPNTTDPPKPATKPAVEVDFRETAAASAAIGSLSKTSSSGSSDLSGSVHSSESTSPTLLPNGKNPPAESASPQKRPSPSMDNGSVNGHNINSNHKMINIQQELKSKLISKKENRLAAFGPGGGGGDSNMTDENTLASQHHQFTNQMILYFKQQQQLQQQQQQQQQQQHHHQQVVHQPKPVGGAKLPLAQSVSVPRLHGHSTKPYDVAHNAHHFNSHNVPNHDMQMSSTATFIPPAMSNHASLEVKQKLKNAILQKLDRDKTNHLSGSFMNSNSSAEAANRNQHKMTVATDHHHQANGGPYGGGMSTNPEQMAALLQYGQLQGFFEQFGAAFMNRSLKDSDENLLRRTTSEPNLKVKSALKATLLTKRNQLHPFNVKRDNNNNNNNSNRGGQALSNHAQISPKQPRDFQGFNVFNNSLSSSSKLATGGSSKYPPSFMDSKAAAAVAASIEMSEANENFLAGRMSSGSGNHHGNNNHINPAAHHQMPPSMLSIDLLRAGLGARSHQQLEESADNHHSDMAMRPDFEVLAKHRNLLGKSKQDDEAGSGIKSNMLIDITSSSANENKHYNPRSISMSSFPAGSGGVNPYTAANMSMLTSWQHQLAASQQHSFDSLPLASLKPNQLYDYLALASSATSASQSINDKSAFFSQLRDTATATAAAAAAATNPAVAAAYLAAQQQQSAGGHPSFYTPPHLSVQDYQNLFLNSHYNKTVQSSMSFPSLHPSNHAGAGAGVSSEYSLAYDQLKKAKNALLTTVPKFGHMAHVEEDNEMLLANELQTAAKLNESLLYGKEIPENEDDDEEEDELPPPPPPPVSLREQHHNNNNNNHHHQPAPQKVDVNEALRKKLLADYETLLKKNIPNQNVAAMAKMNESPADPLTLRLQEILQRSNDRQALELLQYQQELEEQARQQQFLANKNSYFSDPHLLRSLETASISSTDNIHPSAAAASSASNNFLLGLKQKNVFNNLVMSQSPSADGQSSSNNNNNLSNKFLFSQAVAASAEQHNNIPMPNRTSPSQAVKPMAMDVTITHHDDRVYRYTTGIVYDAAMLKHQCTCNNPSNHLETPDRLRAIWNRFRSLDLDTECEVVSTKMASIGDLLMCHNEQYALIFGTEKEYRFKLPKEYLQFYMMSICLAPCNGFALVSDIDNSWNEQNTPTACRVAIGSSYELASLVWNGKLRNGFALVRPPGSHAEFNKPSGFCYFNTTAIVAKMLKKNLLLERILIVDWDVHHGNGTQQLTYSDPNILYMSLHRHDGGSFFPGTGSIDECGQEGSMGKNVNIAWNGNLNPPLGDVEYLAAFRCCVMPIAKSFDPQIILVSCGFDGTENHPRELGGYKISPACFGYMTKMLMNLANGKVILILEGGYDLLSIADCSENCLNALLDRNISPFSDQVLNAMPTRTAVDDLNSVIEVQKTYWPELESTQEFVNMSHRQYVQMFSSAAAAAAAAAASVEDDDDDD